MSNCKKGHKWAEDEIAFLKEHYAENYAEDLALALNRTTRSVYMMANALGLSKSMEWKRQQIIPLLNGGKSHRYKPGQVPHNKGKKMPEHVRLSVQKTMFKPGHIPHNAKSSGDGTLVRRKDYWYIRVSLGKWRQYHTWMWEQHNRPICPKTEMVKFRDGNRENVTIENLYLADRRQNMLENTIHRYPTEIKETIRTLAVFKKRIKQNEEQNYRCEKPAH